jgi:hypothetical protein
MIQQGVGVKVKNNKGNAVCALTGYFFPSTSLPFPHPLLPGTVSAGIIFAFTKMYIHCFDWIFFKVKKYCVLFYNTRCHYSHIFHATLF